MNPFGFRAAPVGRQDAAGHRRRSRPRFVKGGYVTGCSARSCARRRRRGATLAPARSITRPSGADFYASARVFELSWPASPSASQRRPRRRRCRGSGSAPVPGLGPNAGLDGEARPIEQFALVASELDSHERRSVLWLLVAAIAAAGRPVANAELENTGPERQGRGILSGFATSCGEAQLPGGRHLGQLCDADPHPQLSALRWARRRRRGRPSTWNSSRSKPARRG